jgi:hypothetical protein
MMFSYHDYTDGLKNIQELASKTEDERIIQKRIEFAKAHSYSALIEKIEDHINKKINSGS